jgi:hypothetical protein
VGRSAALDAGGQATYSDGAIQTCWMLRAAFKLPLRQAEGLLTSFIELLGCDLAAPDHTTVGRRAIKLPSIARAALPEGALHVVIDSTGLKVYGVGEWLADNTGSAAAAVGASCTWRWLPAAARSWVSKYEYSANMNE